MTDIFIQHNYKINEFDSKIKLVNDEIKNATIALQEKKSNIQYNKSQYGLKHKNDMLLKLYSNELHILTRYKIWVDYKYKDDIYTIIDAGVIRDMLDSGGSQRGGEYNIIDELDERINDEYDIDLTSNDIETFDKLSKYDKEYITSLLENAIELNVETFEWDW